MIAVRDIAWVAGFLEGEGYFSNRVGHIQCGQVQREPLERLQRIFGCGKIKFKKNQYAGTHSWSASGSEAAGVMMTIYAFMSPRRRSQIEASLSGWKNCNPRQPRGAQYCFRGHDTVVYGRTVRGLCRECKRVLGRQYWAHHRDKMRESNG